MNIFQVIAVSGLMLACGQATAAEFNQLQAKESQVGFDYVQMGVPMAGTFNRFAAQVSFDPARLTLARARIEIDVASIDTGSDEGNDAVIGLPWFNAKAYPQASFVSTGLKALGGNRYEATGKLTIKGKTLDVAAPITFQANGSRGIFDGGFAIKRLDYNIGTGVWSDVATVADEIKIKFHLVVNAVPGKK